MMVMREEYMGTRILKKWKGYILEERIEERERLKYILMEKGKNNSIDKSWKVK